MCETRIRDMEQAKEVIEEFMSNGTYISSYLETAIKSNQIEINTDSKTFRTIAKLKEPRDLFALPKELDCPQQGARWPTECQVIDSRIHHIDYCPPIPEPYYIPTGRELQPKPVGEESGTIIYHYCPTSAVNYFSRSCVGGSRFFISSCNNVCDDELCFESRFESGNLAKVIKITNTYYELHLRTDLYTNRHMQWFYFRVTNTKKGTNYRFSIVNLSKGESLYNEGMRPLLYSKIDAELNGIGWRRCADNISYYKNEPMTEEEEQFPNYTLTFNIDFPHDRDEVYIAHCYPYTYTDLQDYLCKLQNHPGKSIFTKLRLLCRTLAGNNVYYLTVTAPSNDTNESKRKKAIVITARVHPGETPASWMMKGFIDFLTGDSNQAKELREKFIFKLIPMLNPDGVIVGNNRCSLTGRDLNRQYRTVIRETYPSVWHTKLLIRRLIEECGVVMYCDLHAHSRKHNVFIYGCENRRGLEKRLQEQVFPLMLHKNCADKFSFESCKFRIQRSKEGTGRVVVWMMGVANSYTMEASFGGTELGSRMGTHFSTQDYEALGKAFCETLLDFCDETPNKERLRSKIINRLMQEGSNADEPTNIDLSDYSSDEGDTSSSSSEAELRSKNIDGISDLCLAPPPSPVLPHSKTKTKRAPKKSKAKLTKQSPVVQRKALPVYRTTIDLTTDQGSDLAEFSSDIDTADESSPVRKVHKQAKHRKTQKTKQKKLAPPELKVTPAQIYDSPDPSDREKSPLRYLSRSLTTTAEVDGTKTKTMEWHQFKCFPPIKSATESKFQRQKSQTSDLKIKLSTLRKNIWTGISDGNTSYIPLSWGNSNVTINNYSTDNESLLRSCSKKLEALETTSIIKEKLNEEKAKKLKQKAKVKLKLSDVMSEYLSQDTTTTVTKTWKKKTRLKSTKTEFSASFSVVDTVRTEQQISMNNEKPKTARSRFRTTGYVATAVQTKKDLTRTRKELPKSTTTIDLSDSPDSNEQENNMQKRKKKLKKKKQKRKEKPT